MTKEFAARVENLESEGLTQIVLEGADQCVKILPEMGSNLYSYQIAGQEMMMIPEDIHNKGVNYGIPVLFPTPNRVKNCTFTFQGKQYPQEKEGTPRFIHGLVYDESWQYKDLTATMDEARVTTYIRIDKGHRVYESFPFSCLLMITYRLVSSGFVLEYAVENLGDQPLPFGFALHPFFGKIDDLNRIEIEVPAENVMEAFDCMPTGKVIKVEGTRYDLTTPKPLASLNLDDVYWKLDASKRASIIYKGLHQKITLQASDDFSHMVVYTPGHRPCFCLENQTCSTDAHNLFAQGKEEVSGLMVLEPGKTHKGWVNFFHQNIK